MRGQRDANGPRWGRKTKIWKSIHLLHTFLNSFGRADHPNYGRDLPSARAERPILPTVVDIVYCRVVVPRSLAVVVASSCTFITARWPKDIGGWWCDCALICLVATAFSPQLNYCSGITFCPAVFWTSTWWSQVSMKGSSEGVVEHIERTQVYLLLDQL